MFPATCLRGRNAENRLVLRDGPDRAVILTLLLADVDLVTDVSVLVQAGHPASGGCNVVMGCWKRSVAVAYSVRFIEGAEFESLNALSRPE